MPARSTASALDSGTRAAKVRSPSTGLRLGADNGHRSVPGALRIAVQLDRRGLTRNQQRGVALGNGDIDNRGSTDRAPAQRRAPASRCSPAAFCRSGVTTMPAMGERSCALSSRARLRATSERRYSTWARSAPACAAPRARSSSIPASPADIWPRPTPGPCAIASHSSSPAHRRRRRAGPRARRPPPHCRQPARRS